MARRKTQWHPLLGRLLRPCVERYYELQLGIPVGDLPREADVVLLRRTGTGALPFQGLWRYLSTWNILEFKGPTVTPRRRHPTIWKEVSAMARKRRRELEMDIRSAVEWVGLERAIEQIGEKEIIEQIGEKEVIEQIGEKKVIERIGKKKVIEQLDVDDILANLGPAKRRALKRRLEAESGKS